MAVPGTTATCEACGALFTVRWTVQKYCSPVHKHERYNRSDAGKVRSARYQQTPGGQLRALRAHVAYGYSRNRTRYLSAQREVTLARLAELKEEEKTWLTLLSETT